MRLCLFLSWFVIGAFTGQAADLYRIAGTVIDSEAGTPLAHATVTLLRYGSTQTVAEQVTGDNGRFSFDVPQGKFSLLAGTRDAQQTFGIRTPDSRIGTSILTGPGLDTSNLTFRWFPLGAISGKIVDEAGEPVQSALVQLLGSIIFAGRRIVSSVGFTRTDDRGEYRFGPLRGGRYFLAVTGTPWYSKNFNVGTTEEQYFAYSPVFYPGSPEASQASPIVLKPAQEARVDFSLSVVRGGNIVVDHDAPLQGSTGLISLITEGIGGSDAFQRQERFAGLPFIFNSVPPGRYIVRVAGSHGNSDFSGRQSVVVNNSDVKVTVKVQPAPVVSGTVQLKNPKAKPRGLLATLIRDNTGAASISTVVRPDGSFTFPSVAVAKWRPSIRSPEGYVVSDVQVAGADFHDGVLDLQDGDVATLRITASDETGRLKGFVMRDETPLQGVMVVLIPQGGAHDQVRDRGFQTDSDGSFDFENVPAADYLLFAVDDTNIEHSNPAVVRPYLANAKRVHIEAHQVYTEKIGLTAVVEEKK